jgi:hypothetical protein
MTGFTGLKADFESHRIEGYARAAEERGVDGYFSAPLISHVEGNLWQGGVRGRKVLNLPDGFKHVLALYDWEAYILPEGCDRKTVSNMMDSSDIFDDESLNALADEAYAMVQDGQTLIHCQAGLNRSGLLASLVLRRMGHTSAEAIKMLRDARSPMVLCNETFENYLLSLDDEDDV